MSETEIEIQQESDVLMELEGFEIILKCKKCGSIDVFIEDSYCCKRIKCLKCGNLDLSENVEY